MTVIAYTYEADHHCKDCAVARFGDHPIWVDSEGNEVGAVFDTDEWYANDIYEGNAKATLSCGTCGNVIEEVELG
jgi:hypothetical protein